MGAIGLSGFRPELADDPSRYLKETSAGEERFDVLVKGARCAGCIAKIERGVKAVPGVREGRLNLSTGKLVVTGKSLKPETILRYIRDLGYDAQPFDAGEMLDAGDREGRFLLRCLAVAGFATVFTMGLTDAIWYGGGDLGGEARRNFFWLAGAVAIPATFWAGSLMGGLVFGIGMIFAGGCASGALWRMGEGHLKLWVAGFFFAWAGSSFSAFVRRWNLLTPEQNIDTMLDETRVGAQVFLPHVLGGWGWALLAGYALLLAWYLFVRYNESTEKFTVL